MITEPLPPERYATRPLRASYSPPPPSRQPRRVEVPAARARATAFALVLLAATVVIVGMALTLYPGDVAGADRHTRPSAAIATDRAAGAEPPKIAARPTPVEPAQLPIPDLPDYPRATRTGYSTAPKAGFSTSVVADFHTTDPFGPVKEFYSKAIADRSWRLIRSRGGIDEIEWELAGKEASVARLSIAGNPTGGISIRLERSTRADTAPRLLARTSTETRPSRAQGRRVTSSVDGGGKPATTTR